MTASTHIEIHEFSTGIHIERTDDGGWLSAGFTGQYRNATIDPIPYAIERSIANKEFEVAKRASSDDPTLIGRVVGSGDSAWSVVAIVTRGTDNTRDKRSLTVYRYFCCQGDKNLLHILSWIEDYQQSHQGNMPIFDPFETKVIGQQNSFTASNLRQVKLTDEVKNLALNSPANLLLPPEEGYDIKVINWLAIKMSSTNGQPVSWAFNVEGLEQPSRFVVIYAASDKAYQIIQKSLASTPKVTTPVVADEQALKSAIKGLMNSSAVKSEDMQVFANELGNTQIPESYWKDLFDSQGANNAFRQGIYSPQMVRLLTLRAIALPETLLEYLGWLEKANSQNDPYPVSNDFQAQINSALKQIPGTAPKMELKLAEGVKVLLFQLPEEQISPESTYKLLGLNNGLWAKASRQIIQDIDSDLKLMPTFLSLKRNISFSLDDRRWEGIRRDLQIYWQQPSYLPQEKYQSLAEVFEQLRYPKLSAFFYRVASGKVPKSVFAQILSDRVNNYQAKIYGILVEREISVPEFIWIVIVKIGSKTVPAAIVVVLVLVSITAGFIAGRFLPVGLETKNPTNNVSETQIPNESTTSSSPLTESNNSSNGISEPIPAKVIEDGKNFFGSKTSKAIKMMESDLGKEFKQIDPNTIKGKIREVLDYPGEELQYTQAFERDDLKEQEKWVKAIYLYQKRHPDIIKKPDGIVESSKETSQKLLKDVKESLLHPKKETHSGA